MVVLKNIWKYEWNIRSGQLKCDDTRAETRFRLSAKRTSPFKSAGSSVHSTIGRRGVRISCSNAGYTMFRGSVKSTGYPLHSPVSHTLPFLCVTVCHHISARVHTWKQKRIKTDKNNGKWLWLQNTEYSYIIPPCLSWSFCHFLVVDELTVLRDIFFVSITFSSGTRPLHSRGF